MMKTLMKTLMKLVMTLVLGLVLAGTAFGNERVLFKYTVYSDWDKLVQYLKEDGGFTDDGKSIKTVVIAQYACSTAMNDEDMKRLIPPGVTKGECVGQFIAQHELGKTIPVPTFYKMAREEKFLVPTFEAPEASASMPTATGVSSAELAKIQQRLTMLENQAKGFVTTAQLSAVATDLANTLKEAKESHELWLEGTNAMLTKFKADVMSGLGSASTASSVKEIVSAQTSLKERLGTNELVIATLAFAVVLVAVLAFVAFLKARKGLRVGEQHARQLNEHKGRLDAHDRQIQKIGGVARLLSQKVHVPVDCDEVIAVLSVGAVQPIMAEVDGKDLEIRVQVTEKDANGKSLCRFLSGVLGDNELYRPEEVFNRIHVAAIEGRLGTQLRAVA